MSVPIYRTKLFQNSYFTHIPLEAVEQSPVLPVQYQILSVPCVTLGGPSVPNALHVIISLDHQLAAINVS